MKLKKVLMVLMATATIITAPKMVASAAEKPHKIRCTAYTAEDDDITADGSEVREGIIAGKRDWLGKTAIIYSMEEDGSIGHQIGIFEFKDTGYGMKVKGSNKGTIQLGTSVDVYRNTLDRCYDWVGEYGDYVYIQIIDAEG